MLKLQTERLFSLIEQFKDEEQITPNEEWKLKMALAECQEYPDARPFLLLNEMGGRLRLAPGAQGFLTEACIIEVGLVAHLIIEEGISASVVDRLLHIAYSEFVAEVEDVSTLSFTETLREAIVYKLHTLAHYLLDNNLCMKEQSPPVEKDTCLQVSLFTSNYDEALFLKICAREIHVNHARKNGLTALFTAVLNDNEFAFRQLLKRADILIEGRFASWRLIELQSTKPSVIALLKAKVQHESYVLPVEANALGFPSVWLSDNNRSRLLQRVERLKANQPLFRDNKELSCAFDDFLHDPTPLPFKVIDRVAVAADCLSYILTPETINQNATSLCGVACLMQHLIMADPAKFIYSVIEICELQQKKPKHLPARVRLIPQSAIDYAYHLSNLWLETVRHNYNEFFDYDSMSRVEGLRGMTRPFKIEQMYLDFGFSVLGETFQIRFAPSHSVGRFFNTARMTLSHYGSLPRAFKIYGSQHREIHDDDARFIDLCETSEKSKYITILLNNTLGSKLLDKDMGPVSILNLVEATHYVTISNFRYDRSTDLLTFDFMTYGGAYSAKLTANEFKCHYLGAIAVEYGQPLILQQDEEPEDSSVDSMGGPA